jgi:hypothetical protein
MASEGFSVGKMWLIERRKDDCFLFFGGGVGRVRGRRWGGWPDDEERTRGYLLSEGRLSQVGSLRFMDVAAEQPGYTNLLVFRIFFLLFLWPPRGCSGRGMSSNCTWSIGLEGAASSAGTINQAREGSNQVLDHPWPSSPSKLLDPWVQGFRDACMLHWLLRQRVPWEPTL